MKTIFILLTTICISVLLCSVYGGWTGHGLLVVKTGFLTIGLMLAVLLAILVFCFCQFVRKGRGEWRRWFLRSVMLTGGWAATFYLILIGTSAAKESGRYFYWKAHKSELESIALSQLEHRRGEGFYKVPTGEVAQLDYPVFVNIDSSNSLRVVGFSHWATTPERRGGFLFIKDANERAVNAIRKNAKWIEQLNTNWFEYGEYTAE
jgi:hypothetical protein